MPRGNGTGPAGFGPMTGRGAGFCAGYGMPGYMNPSFGRSYGFGGGFGRGGGRGHRHWYHATGMPGWQRAPFAPFGYPQSEYRMSGDEEREWLKNQAEALNKTLTDIHRRLEELEAGNENKE